MFAEEFEKLATFYEDNVPYETNRLLVLSDWIEEKGDLLLAQGLRWCAWKSRRPYLDKQRKRWIWYFEEDPPIIPQRFLYK
mgnify:CR=1 FL=1